MGIKERAKNAAIAMLTVSALFLAGETGPWDELFPLRENAVPSPVEITNTVTDAAMPFFAAVTDADGRRRGVKYLDEPVLSLYLNPVIGEIFSLSSNALPVTDEEWRGALEGEGVFFDFLAAHPVRAVAKWQGAAYEGTEYLRRMCLAREGNGVFLYFEDPLERMVYRMNASASSASRLNNYTGESTVPSVFAFEGGEVFAHLDPYVLIPDSIPSIQRITAVNPLAGPLGEEQAKMLSDLFGKNEMLAGRWTDTDGTVNLVWSDGTTLSVGADGFVTYDAGEITAASEDLRIEEIIDLGLGIVSHGIGRNSVYNAARVDLCRTEADGTDCILEFRYSVNGIPVAFSDGSEAARLTISGGIITSAQMRFREYSVAAETEMPSYERQIAAAVSGGEQLLVYLDRISGEGPRAQWIVYNP